MNPRVHITGIGLVTPLGSDARETWDALLAGGFIRDHARANHARPTDIPVVTSLALTAAEQAIRDAGWPAASLASDGTALVVGTSKGPVEAWLADAAPSSLACGLADVATSLRPRLGMTGRGPMLTLSAACGSGLHALIRGAMLLQSGEAERVLVVAAEASLHPLFVGSFRRLGVLPPEGAGCRPFDQHRQGFLMSEAAAAVCLELAQGDTGFQPVRTMSEDQLRTLRDSDSHIVSTGYKPVSHETAPRDTGFEPVRAMSQDRLRSLRDSDSHIASTGCKPVSQGVAIDRYALGGDATHLTGSDPKGKLLRHLLARVVDSRPVDLIHAHATGTPFNDPIELAAIEATVPPRENGQPPHVYSHKAALGHSLGAAGLVSIVLNCLAHRHGVVPPNVRTTDPLPAQHVRIGREAVERPIRRSLAIAAGFGGPTAVVSLVTGEAS